jgi:DNA-binding LacI/PurR family transcriptional regulator
MVLIVSSMMMEDPIVQALHDSNKPFVLFGRHPKLDVNYLDAENVRGGREATLHLLRLGHKRVATITGPQNMIAGYDRLKVTARRSKSATSLFVPNSLPKAILAKPVRVCSHATFASC